MGLDFNKDHFGNLLLGASTPRIFADGTQIFEKLSDIYKRHRRGYYIVAPSGSGKSYFIDNQVEKNWMDGDFLWTVTNAHPKGAWWHGTEEEIDIIERRSDAMTEEAKRYGFWIIGADHYWGTPDAVVIPDWETHQQYLKTRQANNNNGNDEGGLSIENLHAVKMMREELGALAEKGVPVFENFEEATKYLEQQELA